MSPRGTASVQRTSVLHVDSDPSVPERLATVLAGAPEVDDVVTESEPAAALTRLDETAFDCLVSGYDFPDTDGVALLEQVRENHPRLPFILFTGSGDEGVASRAISAGVTDYVRKQSSQGGIDALAERVRATVDRGAPLSETGSQYDREQFERFLRAFPDIVFVMDEEGRYLDLIAGGDRSLLYDDADTLLGNRYHDLLPQETADRFLETIREVLETGEQRRIEYQLDVQDGMRWFEARVGPLDRQAAKRTVYWIARDVTERKRREKEYEQIFDGVNDAIAVFDPDSGDIVTVNERYREILGYDDVETIRELGIEGLSATDEGFTGERGAKLISEVSDTGEPTTVEWRGVTKDGDRLWLEATLAPAEVGGKQRVLSIQRDITERRELEQTYQDIFENVSDGLVVHDPETGEILEVNQRYCELTGYDREELLDGTIRLILPDDPEYTDAEVIERIRQARQEGAQLFEFRGERKNGELFVGEIHLRTIEIRGNERVLASVRDITERKRREQEYEQIFNNVNEIIAVRDPETGEIVDVNQSYADLLGYDREEMQGMSIGDVGVPEEGYDDERGMELLREVISSAETTEVEWKVEDAEGQTHLMEVRATAALINGNQRYLAIGRDITERKRRERAIETLQTATERLQTAETPADVATIAVEMASDVLELPMAVCWFHDEESGQLQPIAATDDAREAGLVSPLPTDRYEYETFCEGDVTEYTPSEQGSDNPLETGVLLPLADHGLVAAGSHRETAADETVLDIARALADHVSTALDRVEREQAVRESERRFRLIAERIDEVIYLAEYDFSEVLYVNPAYEDIWGRPIAELEEDATAFLDAVDPRDRETVRAQFAAMVEEVKAGESAESYEFEYRIRRPDGELRWVNATGYVVGLPGGKRRFIGIVEDTTERKRREQRLEVFNRILRHNLRNQLDVIRSHAEVLTGRPDENHAERIVDAVDKLASIGAEARDTDRIMSTRTQIAETDLSDTILEAIESADTGRNDVDVRTELPATARAETNEEAIQLAVESALENAVEYAESTVTVAVEDSPDGFVVTIDDDGPGISEEELIPIERGTETNLQHGRGLGLWQLRWSVDKLNGDLSFDAEQGTTVRITVPDQQEST